MIPDASNPYWRRVLTSEADLAGAVLVAKVLITRLRREVRLFPKNAFSAMGIALS